MTEIDTIRRTMTERRLHGGERAAREHFRWLMMWAGEPENARELANGTWKSFGSKLPPHQHDLADGLLAAADAVESGLFRKRPHRDPRSSV